MKNVSTGNTSIVLDEELKAFDPDKSVMLKESFAPKVQEYESFLDRFEEVRAMETSPAKCEAARRLRLDIKPVRTSTDKLRKNEKAFYLSASRAIDGMAGMITAKVRLIEDECQGYEDHYKNLEKEAKEKLRREREEKLLSLGDDVKIPPGLEEMEEEVFNNYYEGTKSSIELKKEAEEKAAKAQAEKERVDNLRNSRIAECSSLIQFIVDYDNMDLGTLEEAAYNMVVEGAKAKQKEHEAEQAELKRKADEAEAEKQAALKEQKKKDAEKLRKEKEKLAKEKAEKEKLQREKEEREAKEKAEKEAKAEAEKALALAPDKKKLEKFTADLKAFIDGYSIELKDSNANDIKNHAFSLVNRAISDVTAMADRL